MIKRKLLSGIFIFYSGLCMNAQQLPAALIEEYLEEAGDYAIIYSGELETGYNTQIYKDLPYYMSPEYALGNIVYKGNTYTSLPMRLDWFKDELIVLTPEKKFAKVIAMENVDEVYLHGHHIVSYNPQTKGGLKKGYYLQLMKGDDLVLLSKTHCHSRSKDLFYTFQKKTHYYLLNKGEHYTVKRKKDFERIFPQFKKEINRYTREKKMKFKKNPASSLTELAVYCQILLLDTKQ